ncbi:hypothetical protein PF002_g15097 [Phytophthora fragariae]|uniref:Uncharacterized protein n=1 Tax=Phytophthora fragariae TaxID=53985 RepID=A0A6A3YQ19_9STRA|nr:hypothetical protein PF002_g15097 [Phytophthora fragariae]
MNGPRRICAKRISRLISEFALSSERRDSRQPATPLIGAGWCFHYTKSFKATWHSVARGDVVLQLQDSRKSTTTLIGAGWCFHYTKASFKATGHNVSRGGVVLQLQQASAQAQEGRN